MNEIFEDALEAFDNLNPGLQFILVYLMLLLSVIAFGLMLKHGLNMVEWQHAQQAAAIAECTAYNANSTNGSYCFV